MNEPKYRNKKWLKEKYQEEELSQEKIANICDVSQSVISKFLRRFNIKTRNVGERANHIKTTKKLENFLEGLVLGDGCFVNPPNCKASIFQYDDKHKKYIEWVNDKLEDFDLETRINHRVREKSDWYQLATKTYREFTRLRNKWYPNGEKKIPEDFDLTPNKLLLWFVGDGCYYSNVKRLESVFIAVETLSNDLESKIVPQLEKHDIKCIIQEDRLKVRNNYVPNFYDYLKKSSYRIPDCYSYKFEIELENWGERQERRKPRGKVEVKCDYCGEITKQPWWRVEQGERTFCNQKCYGKWKNKKETVKCEHCEKEFKKSQSQLNRTDHNFCSRECYLSWAKN